MPLGAAIGAVGGIASSFLGGDDTPDIGATRLPAQANLGFGITRIDELGNITQDPNEFTQLARLFAGQVPGFFQQAQRNVIDPSLTGIVPGAVAARGRESQNIFNQLRQSLGQTQQFDPNQFAALQFDRLQSLAERGDEVAANRVANQLFARGRAGADDTAAGAAFEGLARAQEMGRTERALTATNLANQEAQRLFQQQQAGIQNLFGLQNVATGREAGAFQNLLGLTGLNIGQQQQALQNALQFGTGAGQVLQPNFTTLQAVLNAQAQDQASRAGVASTVAKLDAGRAAEQRAAVGEAFAGLADVFK